MSSPEIALARPTDCIELAELSRVAIEYDLRWRWKPSKILALIRDKESTVIVARNEAGDLVGFAAMEFKATRAHLILLASVARFRRQGVATKLLRWLEESAVIAGMDYISLEVRLNNQGAVKFYEAHGYSVEILKNGYYEGVEDAYRMRRDLIERDIAVRRP